MAARGVPLFGGRPGVIVGMIHVGALPGTPGCCKTVSQIVQNAVNEAALYKECGIDALMVENMHDVPYLNRNFNAVGPEVVATMTAVSLAVKSAAPALPCGIQILAAQNEEAIAVAHASGLDFIRAEGFVFGHMADEGMMDSCAGKLLRYRKSIGADNVKIITDIKKKHSSHAITADVSIEETAKAAEYFLSDGVIVTGVATGAEADLDAIRRVKSHVHIPVLVGSGVTIDNVNNYLEASDALIVGSYFKTGGYWANQVERQRVSDFMVKVKSLRRS
ncbi:BtpA/SgcQ family protein [Pelomyxa schiedti]|nr:BtpA/SgcQ family protein [Pelomyxa schiedti]